MRSFLFFLFLLPLIAMCQSQPSVQVTLYNESNGGPSGLVNCIYPAKSGFLWFGCSDGLVRFDGYTFTLFANDKGLPADVTHVTEDRQGDLWMSFAEGGIAKYSPAADHFTNYVLQNEKEPGLNSVQIMTLFFDKAGRLWAGTAQKGLLRFDAAANTTTVYPLTDKHHNAYAPALRKTYNTVYSIAEDRQGTLWLATHDGLYTLPTPNAKPTSLRPQAVQPGHFRQDLFTDLMFDGTTLWLSTWAGGLWQLQTQTGQWQNFLPDEKTLGKSLTNIISNLSPKSKNELWVCSHDKGLGFFSKQTNDFLFFRDYVKNPDLPISAVYGMETDRDGNVWAISNGRLVKLQIQNPRFHFTNVPVTHTDNHNTYDVADFWEDEYIRLIATDYADGVHLVNKQTGTSSILPVGHLPKEEAAMQLRQIYCDSKGRIWVVSRDFLYWYDRKKNTLIKAVQPPLYSSDSLTNSLAAVQEDKSGRIWIATRRAGLYVWDEKLRLFEHYFAETKGSYVLPFNHIRNLALDAKGRMWIAGLEGVLGYIAPGEKKFTSIESQAKTANLKSYLVYADKRGNVWAGTTIGLYCFDATPPQPVLRKIITAADGLRTNPVYSMAEDKAGNIWCLNEAGLCFLPQGGLPIATYSLGDGINKGTGVKLLPTASDTMLLLNYGGYYRFVPRQLAREVHRSPLAITAMQVAGKPFLFEEALAKDKVVELGAGQNYFSFEFAAINYTHPEKQQYAYMLEGIDKDWVQSGSRRFVSYTNVSGGHYTFRVKTVEPALDGKENVLSVPLFVATPFYKTFWFFAAFALLTVAVLYAVHRSRVTHHNQVFDLETKSQRLEKEKALVMYEALKQQLNPHFLFNSLTSLNSLILKDPQTARRFLEGLSSTYRYILKSRESELVELSKEIAFAETYIQLQKTRFKEALLVSITIGEEFTACRIVPVTVQNMLENAIKHNVMDNEAKLCVDIYTENSYIIIRNNLQKKKSVETSNKQGLRSLKTLYGYLTDRPVLIEETVDSFAVCIPLIP